MKAAFSFRLFFVALVALILAGCATRTPPPQVKHITTTEYIVVEVPESFLVATKPTPPVNTGCTGIPDWKECATSRARHIVNLYNNIGQCNADKYRTRLYLEDFAKTTKERNSKP